MEYTLNSTTNGKVDITFKLTDGSIHQNVFDARYVPLETKLGLDSFCREYMTAYESGKTVEGSITPSTEVKNLETKKQILKVTAPTTAVEEV